MYQMVHESDDYDTKSASAPEGAHEQVDVDLDELSWLPQPHEWSRGRQAAHDADPAVRRHSIGWLDRHVDNRIFGRVDS